MNLAAVYHEAKSKYAYSVDQDTVHIRIRTAKDDVDRIYFIYGDPFHWGKNEEGNYAWKNENKPNLEMIKEYSTAYHDYYFIAVKPKYKRMKYLFILEKGNQQIAFGSRQAEKYNGQPPVDLFNFFNFPFLNAIDVYQAPEWAKDTIWYQIFPERFCNGDPSNDPEGTLEWNKTENVTNQQFYGGDLQGVIDQLDYIKDLGVNGIYFTPIFKSPSSHKYDTEDYYQIDPQFGSNELFKELVEEAHKRGIRIMLDAVFNHCGWNHPFFQDVLKKGEQSKYKDYFHIHQFPVFEGDPKQFQFIESISELNFHSFAFTPFMPKWNTENPEVVDYLLDIAAYWIREFNIDAWRLDVSNEVDHQFWKEFRKRCEQEKPDFFIVGENWDESNPWIGSDQMHSVMNYHFMYPTWSFFGKDEMNAKEFEEAIASIQTMYPKNVLPNLFNLLESHDTSRIHTICGENIQKTKLAYVFLMTFTGCPSIYYGGEIARSGGHDPDNRRCMIWDEDKQNHGFRNFIKRLIALRHQEATFKAVDLKFLSIENHEQVVMYEKTTNDETITVILNNSDEPFIWKQSPYTNQTVTNLYTGKPLIIQSNLMIPAYDFLIIKH